MGNNNEIGYDLDMVLCIDGTGSMVPCIDKVKENALSLYKDIQLKFDSNGKPVRNVRVKVIVFRDYASEGASAIIQSEFFKLPDEEVEFSTFVNNIQPSGGGDNPENALEALFYAMTSDFCAVPDYNIQKARHIIMLFTDAAPLPMQSRSECLDYPKNLPADDLSLFEIWDGSNQEYPVKFIKQTRKMNIFGPPEDVKAVEGRTPSCDGWAKLFQSGNLESVLYTPVNSADGLKSVSWDDIIEAIFHTAA